MALERYTALGTAQTAITGTDLDALASGGIVLGPELNNTTNRNRMGVIHVALNAAVTPSGNTPGITVWFVPKVAAASGPIPPGETAGSLTDNPPTQYQVAFMDAISGVATTQRFTAWGLELPQGLFHVAIRQDLGVGFPASGNVCELYAYDLEVV